MSTSITDDGRYPDFCYLAATNDNYFKDFKRNPIYTSVLEHTTYEQGLSYLKVINRCNPEILEKADTFRENDKYGNPKVFDFPKIGKFSPTTLRYMKVLSDLISMFGSLNNLNIVEIGGGYGGQAKIILDYFKVKSYTVIDLKEVIELTKRHNGSLGITNINYLTQEMLENIIDCDLLISNYAYTECDINTQIDYYNKVIKSSERGYITCNFISDEFSTTSFNAQQLVAIIDEPLIIEEEPKTHNKNFILSWPKNKIKVSDFKVIGLSSINKKRLKLF